MIHDPFSRFWVDLLSRPAGPLKLRFLLQPGTAALFAIRSGLRDHRDGKPAFFWALFAAEHRQEMLRDLWESIGKLFVVACVLDCAYQVIEFRWIYPFEALVVAFFLAMIPYLVVRGLANRIAGLGKRLRNESPSRSTAGVR